MTENTNQAAESARLARVAATSAAHAAGRLLADQHMSHADLIKASNISPSTIHQQDTLAEIVAGRGVAVLGLEAYSAQLEATLSVPLFAGPYGIDEALAVLAGVREVKQATDNRYRVARP